MDFDIDDLIDNPAFLILAGGGILMELIGWVVSKKAHIAAIPFWELLILMLGTIIASAIFANRE